MILAEKPTRILLSNFLTKNNPMKLYATTTSERASKGQGGDWLEIEITGEKKERLAIITVAPPQAWEYETSIKVSFDSTVSRVECHNMTEESNWGIKKINPIPDNGIPDLVPTLMKKQKIIWHIRVKNSIREFHPSYRELSETEVKQVPDEYWYPDPIHITKGKK